MIRNLFVVQCDSCGKPSGQPKVSKWQARDAATDAGWQTAVGRHAHDLCPDCVAKRSGERSES